MQMVYLYFHVVLFSLSFCKLLQVSCGGGQDSRAHVNKKEISVNYKRDVWVTVECWGQMPGADVWGRRGHLCLAPHDVPFGATADATCICPGKV